MQKPKNRNSEISRKRVDDWLTRFTAYRRPPSRADIDRWLRYFSVIHRDIAARILDCVKIVSDDEIHNGFRRVLDSLPGWHPNARNRSGRWFFVGFGGPGESGSAMLRPFREANRLNSSRFDYLFKNSTELPKLALTALDTVVFIDDFSGTGSQVCGSWDTVKELLGSDCTTYLILTAVTNTAQKRIRDETDTTLMASIVLEEEDNVFSRKCKYFTPAERDLIFEYGKTADAKNPKGYGNCGLLFILSHKTPNNTVPILHANHHRWRGLFPRYL